MHRLFTFVRVCDPLLHHCVVSLNWASCTLADVHV